MKKSQKEIARITAANAVDTAREVLYRKNDRLVNELLDYIDQEVVGAANSGHYYVRLQSIDMGEPLTVSVLSQAAKDLRDRGFGVFDLGGVDQESGVLEEVDLKIVWIDSETKGNRK